MEVDDGLIDAAVTWEGIAEAVQSGPGGEEAGVGLENGLPQPVRRERQALPIRTQDENFLIREGPVYHALEDVRSQAGAVNYRVSTWLCSGFFGHFHHPAGRRPSGCKAGIQMDPHVLHFKVGPIGSNISTPTLAREGRVAITRIVYGIY